MMRLASRLIFGISFPCIAILAFPWCLFSQESVSSAIVVASSAGLPEAPLPQAASALQSPDGQMQSQQTQSQQAQSQQTPPSQTQTQTATQPDPAPSQAQTPAQG